MSTPSDDLVQPREIAISKRLPLWHNRDYLLLVSGQGVSTIGSQISLVAFPLLIFTLTHSPAQTGLISALRSFPYALLTLPAGVLVDRWDRKKLMILCDLGRALALGSIPLALMLGGITYLQLYIVSLVEGSLYVFFNLAEMASYPHVVASEQLSTATGQNQTLTSLAETIGPALGPILYGFGGAIPFLTDAISYAVSMLSLLWIKATFQEARIEAVQQEKHLWREMKEGIVWLWKDRMLRFLAILTFGLLTPCMGYVLLIIVLAQGLHTSDVALGLIFAGGGVGSVLGALVTNFLRKRFGFEKVMLATIWLWALGWLLYPFAPDTIILGIINVVGMTVVPVYMILQNSYRLANIPDQLQGRVNSVYRLIALSGQPLGIATTGLLLQLTNPVITVVILFIPQGLLVAFATFNPGIRRLLSKENQPKIVLDKGEI